MQANKTIRIVIADDHQIVREGLRSLLRTLPAVEVVGEAPDGRAAVELAAQLLPDVVVMDVSMPGLNGIDATRQVIAAGNGTKVIALSGHTTARAATEMLQAGALAFVRKESAFQELKEALDAVMLNRVFVSPAVSDAVTAKMKLDTNYPGATLSMREREVLQLMAEGKATKEVARHLSVSVKTIETHRRNLMEKLQIYSVAELTKYAIREGVTTV